jgi:peroxiredoxin family protein
VATRSEREFTAHALGERYSATELIINQLEGGKLIGCHMAMSMFELESQDFVPGVDVANAADFLKMAQEAHITLFT